jgi:hypothetical protein
MLSNGQLKFLTNHFLHIFHLVFQLKQQTIWYLVRNEVKSVEYEVCGNWKIFVSWECVSDKSA